MIGYIVVAVICILAGGVGGYMWGAAAERKAQAILTGVGLGNVAKKL
jgi:hypothetical protein